MSAFLIDDETMQRVAIGFLLATMTRDEEPASAERVTETGAQLFAMNCSALVERYQSRAFEYFDFTDPPSPPLKEMRWGNIVHYHTDAYSPIELVQIYKSMLCFLYQCAEGGVVESDLFKRVDDASRVLACRIVDRLPAYEAAVWG
jgi:hypothetical protein